MGGLCGVVYFVGNKNYLVFDVIFLRRGSRNLFKVFYYWFVMVKWQGEIKTVGQEINEGEVKDVVVVESGEEAMSRRMMLFLSVVSFLGSMFFWSHNFTGNVILNFERPSANWIGGILFISAIVGFLAYVQKIKK